ncbi:hypothetical protein [Haloplanus salilacus]|uniref:hypothetical protein n=1 Tax=Haloplanus salilacus TaxID=2949994 RepID=UPI0030D34071
MTGTTHATAHRKRRAALEAIPPIERSETDGRLRITHGFRGITPAQAIRYLESLGGDRIDDRTVDGTGWRATLSTRAVPVGPSYRLTEVRVTWTGDPDAVESVVPEFRLKAFRAPADRHRRPSRDPKDND